MGSGLTDPDFKNEYSIRLNDFKEEMEDKLGLITPKGGWKYYKFKFNSGFASDDELDTFV